MANQPFTIDYTLTQPSEVSAYITLQTINAPLVTILHREPLGTSANRLYWNGQDHQGIPIEGLNNFALIIRAYKLPNNTIYVKSAPQIDNLQLNPTTYEPATEGTNDNDGLSHITFNMSQTSDIDLVIVENQTGTEILRKRYQTVTPNPSGQAEITWDGKDYNNELIDKGQYLIGIQPIQENGGKGAMLYAIQRIYY